MVRRDDGIVAVITIKKYAHTEQTTKSPYMIKAHYLVPVKQHRA